MAGETDLRIDRLIRAPRVVVWRAWSDPRQLEQWWLPAPVKCRVAALDLLPGGGFETLMSDDGVDFRPHFARCFLQIVPEHRIVFTTCLLAGWRPRAAELPLTAIISLTEEAGGTRYHAVVLHRTAADARRHEDLGFYRGWGTTINQLAQIAESGD